MSTFYGTLAPLWPLVSPVEEYASEAGEIFCVLGQHAPDARTLLELGCGGGHVAFYLKRRFDCTLTDLSAPMLACSRRLSPDCVHVEGDMRSLALARTFDVVLAHDAIDYMTSEDDLRAAFDTAWRHLGPGGLACFIPDHVAETYAPDTSVSGSDGDDGRAVRMLEWSEPVKDGEHTVTVHYSFVVRDPAGEVTTFYERHTIGLFPRATWERLLTERGFLVETVLEETDEDREGRLLFLAKKPE